MFKFNLSAVTFAVMLFGVCAESCEAGPLLDWLRGRRTNNVYRYNAFYQGGAPAGVAPGAGFPGATMNQMPGSCTSMCPTTKYQTVNRVVANYVPLTAYRTEWYRVPTTYYRPTTSTNPQTGCITTCMKPCTTYQMQARRVPYTTYQTVYRTVQHRVPYTVYETSYSAAGSCNSCGTGGVPGAAQMTQPYYGATTPAANYGLNPNANYSTPANTVPQLSPTDIRPDQTLQRPIVYPPQPQADPAATKTGADATNSSHRNPINVNPPVINTPANPAPVVDDSNRTASLIRGKWNYSPVRHAGYLTSVSDSTFSTASSSRTAQTSNHRSAGARNSEPFKSSSRNSSWKSASN